VEYLPGQQYSRGQNGNLKAISWKRLYSTQKATVLATIAAAIAAI